MGGIRKGCPSGLPVLRCGTAEFGAPGRVSTPTKPDGNKLRTGALDYTRLKDVNCRKIMEIHWHIQSTEQGVCASGCWLSFAARSADAFLQKARCQDLLDLLGTSQAAQLIDVWAQSATTGLAWWIVPLAFPLPPWPCQARKITTVNDCK